MKELFKEIFKNVWLLLFVVAILVTAAINIYLEFSNWEYSRAKLWIEYWPIFLSESVVILILYILTKKYSKW